MIIIIIIYRVNGIDSETERIEVGVPQGSCLVPLLFLVYINDLPCAVKNSTTSMYADDTTLFFRSKNIDDLNEAINSDLRDLDSWLSGNKLSLNVAKTQGMLICTKNKQRSLESTSESLCLKIRDNDLALVEKTKYLGVQVDNSLDWKEHIKSVSAKVSRAVGLLKYAKRFLPQNSLKTLYTSIVEPTSATAALYGNAVALLKSRNFRSFKTEQLRSSLIVALMPLANHLSRI